MSKENWIFDSVEKHKKKESLPQVGLEVVSAIGNKLIKKKKNLVKEEERLKILKAQIRDIEEKELPDAMASCNGMTRFDLEDGSQISVKDDLFCSIPEEKRAGALKWLEENGHSGLIKHDVKVSFAKGEYDEADKLIEVLNKNFKDIPYDERSTVHAGTLKTFAKERYSLGETLPEEYFSVYEASVAKVKLGKEK